MTAPTPNAALAYAALDQIDAHPETWRQDVWIGRADCGTVACLAGWVCLLSGDQPLADYEDDETENVRTRFEDVSYVPMRAAMLLGIKYDRNHHFGHRLFNAHHSRADLGRLVAEIFGPRPDGGEGGNVTDGGEPA